MILGGCVLLHLVIVHLGERLSVNLLAGAQPHMSGFGMVFMMNTGAVHSLRYRSPSQIGVDGQCSLCYPIHREMQVLSLFRCFSWTRYIGCSPSSLSMLPGPCLLLSGFI